jgi:hypothetical protein
MTCRKTLAALVFGICATPLCAADVNSNAIELLSELKPAPLTIYWELTPEAMEPPNRELTLTIARLVGGVTVGHTGSVGAEWAETLQRETGCKVCLFVGRRLSMAEGWPGVMRHYAYLSARAAQGLCPDVVFFHYEPPADEGLIAAYLAAIRAVFPGVPIAGYGWPGYSLSSVSDGHKSTYEHFRCEPAFDIACSDLYAQGAAANSKIFRYLREFAADRKIPCMPVWSWGGYYDSVYNPSGRSTTHWHWRLGAQRTPDTLWNMGNHIAVMVARPEWRIDSIYAYKGAFGRRTDLVSQVEQLHYLLQGLQRTPLNRIPKGWHTR